MWIIYWLIWWFFIWISNFFSKVVAHEKINKNRIFLYSSISHLFISLIYLAFNFEYTKLSIILFIIISLRIITAIEKNLFIVEWLKYIETNIYYPIHKIIHVILTFMIWMFVFWEYLNYLQFIWILLWIIVIILLTDKNSRNEQIDYKKWVFFLLLSNLMILVSSTINKYIAEINFDIATYMFLSWLIWSIYLMIFKKDIFTKNVSKSIHKREFKIWIIKWILTLFWFTSLLLALRQWPFVLVQLINVSSIFIPIIFSFIIYKERININKIIAFFLFFVVIYLVSL